MANATQLPTYSTALVDAGGRSSGEYYRFFQSINTNLVNYNALDARVTKLESLVPPVPSDVLGLYSIKSSGHLTDGIVRLALAGDVDKPGNTYVYGTDDTGTKGWQPLFSSFATSTLALTKAATTNLVTYDLAALADSGVGAALVKITRDTYGRISGTHAATTDDLTEGSTNLYFTNARAQDATGAAIAAGTQTGITVTYNSGSHSIDFFVAPADFASKAPVSYAATSALPANTYNNGASGVGATLTGTVNGPLVIDGVTLASSGLRVLIAAEAASANNGWYVVTQVGVVAVSPYILTRSTDADTGAEIGPGYLTGVEAPSALTPGANNGKVFISVAPVPFVVGTDSLLFSAVGSAGGVGSVFGRTGTVVAMAGDYTFSMIGSTPTTLAGYGITDALTGNRLTAAVTSASGAAQNGTITMGKQVTLLNLSSNAPLRIRLYTTVAAQVADQSRTVSAYPAPGSGLLFEGVTTAALPGFDITSCDAFNNESTVTSAIAYRLEPASAVSTTATFTYSVTQS